MGTQVLMLKPSIFPAIALLAILTACSDTPTTTAAKKEPEKLEPVTGQSAVFKMYQMARSWAPDAQVMKMQSMRLTEVKDGPPGTAPAWQATFVSAAKSQSRSYTYLHRGGRGQPAQRRFRRTRGRLERQPRHELVVPHGRHQSRHRRRLQDRHGEPRAATPPNTTRRTPASRSPSCWKEPTSIPTRPGASSGANPPAPPTSPS